MISIFMMDVDLQHETTSKLSLSVQHTSKQGKKNITCEYKGKKLKCGHYKPNHKIQVVKPFTIYASTATLWSTTVSTVSPGPNPNRTPHSSPSPVVLSPLPADFLLISSRMNNTHALDMLP